MVDRSRVRIKDFPTNLYTRSRSDILYLSIIVIVFTIFYSVISWLRFVNFYTTNWDFGIAGQLLWSTTKGYLMYETTNYVNSGAMSFLELHSAFVAYPIAFLYNIYPHPTFLLVLQSVIVSLSSIPLFLITGNTSLSKQARYAVVIFYLSSLPLVTSILYDYHWESFIPVEALFFYYTLTREKYLYSGLILLIGSATLEVFPFLAAGFVLFDLSNRLSMREARLSNRVFRYGIILLFTTIIAYLSIRIVQKLLIPLVVGTAPSLARLSNSTFLIFHFSFGIESLLSSFSYWIILYFSLFFIPIFYPKHIISLLPWIFSSVFIEPVFSSSLGNQYAFVAIPGLIVGFVYALDRVSNKWGSSAAIVATISCILSIVIFFIPNGIRMLLDIHRNPEFSYIVWAVLLVLIIFSFVFRKDITAMFSRNLKPIISSRLVKSIKKYSIVILIVALISVNTILSPLNPENKNATVMPGYDFRYAYNIEYTYMQQLTREIPQNSTILASDNLFPFVSNYVSSYSLRWTDYNYSSIKYFPFGSSLLPEYLLLSSSQIYIIPNFIYNAIFTLHEYGMESYIFSSRSYPGSIYLFKLGFGGNSTEIGSLGQRTTTILDYQNLSIGPNSTVMEEESSLFGKTILGPVSGYDVNSPVVWYGPYRCFEPGMYNVTINMTGIPIDKSYGLSKRVALLNGGSFGGTKFYSRYVDANTLKSGNWTVLKFLINITDPFPSEFRGYYIFNSSIEPAWQLELNYITIQRVQ